MRSGRICRVPDDAPPLHRRGHEYWPPGWGPAACSGANGAAAGSSSAAQQAPGEAQMPAAAAQEAATVEGLAAACHPGGPLTSLEAAAAASGRGAGSRRRVRCQRDVFELLGLPWREPFQRDMP